MTNDDQNPASEQTLRARGFTNMIEVQFQDGRMVELDQTPDGACAFRSEEDAISVNELNDFIRNQGCRNAERIFEESSEDNADAEFLASMDDVEAPDLSGIYVLHFPEHKDVHDIARQLRSYAGVKHAAPLPLTKFALVPQTPTDELLFPVRDKSRDFQWYINRCKVDEAWKLGYTGKEVVIADLDSGFQTEHPDLKGRFNLNRAFNTVTGNNQLSKSGNNLRHGTAVAGQAGAAADGSGMVGIAHDAELWPIEVGPPLPQAPDPIVDPRAWAKAIMQVIKFICTEKRRVVVIIEGQTFRNGNITQITMIREAVLSAIAHGAVVCVAAGNGNHEVSETDCDDLLGPCHGEIFKPAGIIVGATDINDLPYQDIVSREGTNFGDAIVVSAPGDPMHDLTCTADLTSAFPYTPFFGATSGATAKVAGAVALILQANDQLNHADVEQIFRNTGTPITSKPLGRLLNCEEAVLMAEKFPGGLLETDRGGLAPS